VAQLWARAKAKPIMTWVMDNSADIGNPPPAESFPYDKYFRQANGALREECLLGSAATSRKG
jgi:hypothetical protein